MFFKSLIPRSTNHNYSFHMQLVYSHKTDWILSEPSAFTHLTESYLASSHTTDRILTESPLPALSCHLYHKAQQSDECTCMRMSSRYLYKRKEVVCCVLSLRSFLQSCCYLFIPLSPYFFTLTLLLYFNKPNIFVFGALVYHFKKPFNFS